MADNAPSEKINRLATKLAITRADLERVSATKTELEKKQDGLERDLFDELERAGIRAVKIDGLGTFSLNDLAWARVTDAVAVRKWCEDNLPELLSPNRTRLAVLVREFVRGERAEMPDGVEATFSRKISWRKS